MALSGGNMRVIGLTGSIACGKSTVSSFLISRGFPVVDGDRISRDLTGEGSPVLQKIGQVFGPDVLYEDGTLNRRRLGRIVFSDPAARETLDRLMAPYLLEETRARIEEARDLGNTLCFLDMPLLFEKGYDRLCDAVWTVWLPKDLQLHRLMERDGYSREEALSRMDAVMSSDEKASRSDAVIDNSGSVEQTYGTVAALLDQEFRAARNLPRRNRTPAPAASPVPSYAPHVYRDIAEAAQDQKPENAASPGIMERPRAASMRHENRKSAWRLPVWLKSSLIAVTAVLAVGFTALMLMNGYLKQCGDRHMEEQRQIDRNYPLAYRELIEKYAAEYNLSPAYVSAIIMNESSFNRMNVSSVGARGLMQLMPDTADWVAGKLKVSGFSFEMMFDEETNIRFGCWYLNYLSKLFLGDPVSVTAAYHAGQGQVKTWLSDPALSEDGYTMPLDAMPEGPTKKYAGRVIRDYGIYQEKYFTPDIGSPDSLDAPAASGSAGG